jgi:cytochrome c-type biogenesis protein CcmE
VSKGLQIAVGGLAVAALLGWYGWTALEDAGTYRYFQTLEEFRAVGAEAGPSRVHGYVTEGSIQRDVASKSVRFVVQSTPPHAGAAAGAPLVVRYASLETPDLFKDGAEVVVEGELAAANGEPVFHATKVLAKCPSKFEAEGAQASF